ncbi:hypothetical protein PpBr36_07928 [Pyricularia pennisetigena]|uniref:hypothetical protein n=1 Tax=Pyricularia pennisetigena TaxID=1578925 RepID=UPI00114F9344|nr:hypothetical protein PpBr36_07928 [Pyricularia pennisetigena]TLS25758.1 hypothetical protein PpBr36_07928 [Pyricularia pennisetigena]
MTYLEQLPHQPRSIAEILLDQLTTNNAQEGVGIISQDTNNANALVVKEYTGARLKKVLVDKAHDANIVFWACSARNDSMVVVNHLLKGTNAHWAASHVVDTTTLVGHAITGVQVRCRSIAVFGGLDSPQAFLIFDKLLF